MKTKLTVIFTMVIFLFNICASAQVIDPKEEAEKEGTERVNQKIDKSIDKGLDKLEKGIGSLFGKKKNKNDSASGDQQEQIQEQEQEQATDADMQTSEVAAPVLNWAKYDFIPGEKVIFDDNLEVEENGEFPSRWDLLRGNVEIAEFGGENVIMFQSGMSAIIPFLKNPDKDYLPDIFTIEMDLYFESSEQAVYFINLHDLKNQNQSGYNLHRIQCLAGGLMSSDSQKGYAGMGIWDKPKESQWRHIAIGFNTRALKAYYDDERLINIPNLEYNPTGLTIEIVNTSKPTYYFAKNIRIAEGGQKLYDKFLQDGKIIANGIRFDVNKATLKPESMGIINEIADLMKENPDIKFSVEGHTDSDGDDAFNQILSEQRAETVVKTLLKFDIENDRFTYVGCGESKPLDTNNTPEGKANNRRVEFVKM